jgi:hypothetical protein
MQHARFTVPVSPTRCSPPQRPSLRVTEGPWQAGDVEGTRTERSAPSHLRGPEGVTVILGNSQPFRWFSEIPNH